MILKKIVTEKVIEFFKSEYWKENIEILGRGEDVYHAHVITDSILAPKPVASIIKAYFDIKGWPLQRRILIIPNGRGVADLYGIHPKGCGHFEVFLQYTDQTVLEPARDPFRGKANVEYWDKAFMENYYRQFNFKEFGPVEEVKVRTYFKSKEWEMSYLIMSAGRNLHSHTLVKTSIHPEILLKYGVEAIEAKGWGMGRATSIVFGMNGLDRGKITYLVNKPAMILELEWDFDLATVIEPGPMPMYRIYNEDLLLKDTAHCNYFVLDDGQIEEVIRALK
jgi:hypothetical protein